MKAIKALAKVFEKINDIWEFGVTKLLVLMTTAMVLSIFLQITSRILGYSIIWTSDVATFLFAWMAFLGSAVAVRDNDHFIVDVFPAKMKTFWFNLALNVLALAAQFIIGYIMFRYGLDFVKSMDLRLSYSLGIKLSYITVVVPISGFLVLLATVERILKIVEISQPVEEEGLL